MILLFMNAPIGNNGRKRDVIELFKLDKLYHNHL